ncbi:MAG: hypothetical protein ABEJ02_04525 [Candidatus Paceibacteria bacterium]
MGYHKKGFEDGWQMNVELRGDHVIKWPKEKDEIEKKILPYLESKGQKENLSETRDKILEDIENSIRILKNSNIPKECLANIKFRENKKIEQKQVRTLNEIFENPDHKGQIKEILEKYVEFKMLLWEYGIHEKTYKIDENFGIDKGEIVLIDPFEITQDKNKVLRQINKKKWSKKSKYEKFLDEDSINYLINKIHENWTKENLEKLWKRKTHK